MIVSTGRIRHSSTGFHCFEDEFRHEGATVVRHLVSIRLSEVSPVAQPGYLNTSAAVRSLARQVGEAPEDVESLAAQGELRSLFVRTDRQVAAPPTVVPRPLEVAHRSAEADDGMMDLRRRRLALMKRKIDWETKPMDPRRALLELARRRMEWDDDGTTFENRSLAAAEVDRYGNAIHWNATER